MGISTINFLRQLNDLDKISSTALSDTDLLFTLAAGRSVNGSFWCPVRMATTSGVNFRLDVNAVPTLYLLNARFYRVQTNVVSPWALDAEADFNDQLTGSPGLNIVNGDFFIQANAAITVKMRFAQLSSTATITTLLKGAYMSYIIT